MGIQSWIKTGDFIGADFCYHELPEKLDIYDNETFMASASKFYVVGKTHSVYTFLSKICGVFRGAEISIFYI